MKHFRSATLIATGIVIFAALVLGVHWLADRYLKTTSSASTVAVCNKTHSIHTVLIKDGQVVPKHTQAHLCDKLVIKNTDSNERLMAFGPHENHIVYDGISEVVLRQNQSFNVTLNQAGTFLFHDHLDDVVAGDFTVNQ